MLASLLHRTGIAAAKSLRVPLSRNVHSMTFRAVSAPNSMYTGAFQKSATYNYKSVTPCLEIRSANLLPPSLSNIFVRGFKTPLKTKKTKLKTKKAAKKRFILTGRGKLKRNHSGKSHLTGHMSRTRKTRLNAKVFLSGTNLKNMKKLINV